MIVPNDVQELEAHKPPREHGTVHSGIGYACPALVPSRTDIARAAAVLNDGQRVAMSGWRRRAAVQPTRSSLSPSDWTPAVAKALLGKAAICPMTSPWLPAPSVCSGTRPSYRMMTHCDTLLMVGSGFPYSEFLPEGRDARGVQIDIDPRMLSLRYPMEVNLVGDGAATLRELLPMLDQKNESGWRSRIEADVRDWWHTLEATRRDRCAANQPAARVLGAVEASSRQLHRHRRHAARHRSGTRATSSCVAA